MSERVVRVVAGAIIIDAHHASIVKMLRTADFTAAKVWRRDIMKSPPHFVTNHPTWLAITLLPANLYFTAITGTIRPTVASFGRVLFRKVDLVAALHLVYRLVAVFFVCCRTEHMPFTVIRTGVRLPFASLEILGSRLCIDLISALPQARTRVEDVHFWTETFALHKKSTRIHGD